MRVIKRAEERWTIVTVRSYRVDDKRAHWKHRVIAMIRAIGLVYQADTPSSMPMSGVDGEVVIRIVRSLLPDPRGSSDADLFRSTPDPGCWNLTAAQALESALGRRSTRGCGSIFFSFVRVSPFLQRLPCTTQTLKVSPYTTYLYLYSYLLYLVDALRALV